MIVYTTGYSGDKTPRGTRKAERLRDLAQEFDALIFDIRYSPWSQAPCWRKVEMEALLGDQYRWLGDLLGNRNYNGKYGDGIQIIDIEAGIREILAAAPRNVILLCGCEDCMFCHRSNVAYALKDKYDTGLAPMLTAIQEINYWGATEKEATNAA